MPSAELSLNGSKRKLDDDEKFKKSIESSEGDSKRQNAEVLGNKGLQRARFIVIDKDGNLQKRVHIFKFLTNRNEPQVLSSSAFSFTTMLKVLEIDKRTAHAQKYQALLPCNHVVDISSEQGWKNAIEDLQQWMSRMFVSEDIDMIQLGPERYIRRFDNLDSTADARDKLIGCEVVNFVDENEEAHWKNVENFFCYDADTKEGIKLPGLAESIAPQTMIEVYDMLDGRVSFNNHKLSNIETELVKMTVASLCLKVWDVCSVTHKEHDCHEQLTDLEQAYHIQCACRPNSLTKTVATTYMRNINILTVDSDKSLEYVLSVMKRMFNDDVKSYLLHAMIPMEFRNGELKRVFGDFGTSPKDLINDLCKGIAAHRDGKTSSKDGYGSGGPERIILITTAAELQRQGALDSVLNWQLENVKLRANTSHGTAGSMQTFFNGLKSRLGVY